MKAALGLFCLLLSNYAVAEYSSSTINSSPAIRAMLEGYRDKLTSPELANLKASANQFLAAYGSVSEDLKGLRKTLETMTKTYIPALETRLKPFQDKEDAYLKGTLDEKEFTPIKTDLDEAKKALAAARGTLKKNEAGLTALETRFNAAEAALNEARTPLKNAEDKMLAAMAQSLASMNLQQNIDALRMDGLSATDKLDVIEASLADSVLETYVKTKMGKLLFSPDLCKAAKKCARGYVDGDPDKQLKDVFPGQKTHQ